MTAAVAVEQTRHALIRGFALKSISAQVTTPKTTLHLQIRDLSPIGGTLEVTNAGENKFGGVVNVTFHGEGNHIRNVVTTDVLALKPGESEEYGMGIMMPGHIVIEVGEIRDNMCEVMRLVSPGGQCGG